MAYTQKQCHVRGKTASDQQTTKLQRGGTLNAYVKSTHLHRWCRRPSTHLGVRHRWPSTIGDAMGSCSCLYPAAPSVVYSSCNPC